MRRRGEVGAHQNLHRCLWRLPSLLGWTPFLGSAVFPSPCVGKKEKRKKGKKERKRKILEEKKKEKNREKERKNSSSHWSNIEMIAENCLEKCLLSFSLPPTSHTPTPTHTHPTTTTPTLLLPPPSLHPHTTPHRTRTTRHTPHPHTPPPHTTTTTHYLPLGATQFKASLCLRAPLSVSLADGQGAQGCMRQCDSLTSQGPPAPCLSPP